MAAVEDLTEKYYGDEVFYYEYEGGLMRKDDGTYEPIYYSWHQATAERIKNKDLKFEAHIIIHKDALTLHNTRRLSFNALYSRGTSVNKNSTRHTEFTPFKTNKSYITKQFDK
jgi:hypothetical protein